MTHCTGYGAMAVARARDARSVGIDAEPDEALPEGLLSKVAPPAGQDHLTALATRSAGPAVHGERLLFSAEENVFKARFPVTGRESGFLDAEVTFDSIGGSFTARVLAPAPAVPGPVPERFAGRWSARDGLLATAVVTLAEEGPTRLGGS